MSEKDLGRRAVACKHWRWMPGMLATGAIEKGGLTLYPSGFVHYDNRGVNVGWKGS